LQLIERIDACGLRRVTETVVSLVESRAVDRMFHDDRPEIRPLRNPGERAATSTASVLRPTVAAAHAAAERSLGLLDVELTVSAYAVALRALVRFHRAVEPQLAQAVRKGILEAALVGEARLPDLENDLRCLGEPAGDGRSAVSTLEGPEEAFAAAYVLAGSALGARLLERRLPREVTRDARRYVEGAIGEAAMERWELIRSALDARDEVRRAAVGRCAVMLFAALEQDRAAAGG
jgi:heme oxygenase